MTIREWVRLMFQTKAAAQHEREDQAIERDAIKQEIAKGLHDAAARLHVLEYQVDVEARRARRDQGSG